MEAQSLNESRGLSELCRKLIIRSASSAGDFSPNGTPTAPPRIREADEQLYPLIILMACHAGTSTAMSYRCRICRTTHSTLAPKRHEVFHICAECNAERHHHIMARTRRGHNDALLMACDRQYALAASRRLRCNSCGGASVFIDERHYPNICLCLQCSTVITTVRMCNDDGSFLDERVSLEGDPNSAFSVRITREASAGSRPQP